MVTRLAVNRGEAYRGNTVSNTLFLDMFTDIESKFLKLIFASLLHFLILDSLGFSEIIVIYVNSRLGLIEL